MNQRTSEILEAAIQEFIDTGSPVSSGWLYKQYDFGIKPAMIRLELDGLEDEGYLEQPHHSAGRVPTDTGYEFYVKRALESKGSSQNPSSQFSTLSDLLAQLSAQLGLLSIAVDMAHNEIHKTGLEALINSLDWQDREQICSVIHDFESVDERLPRATEKMIDGPQVFIGKKSPVTQSEDLSVIAGNYKIGDATISIFAIGPKRMDYKRTIRIFKNL